MHRVPRYPALAAHRRATPTHAPSLLRARRARRARSAAVAQRTQMDALRKVKAAAAGGINSLEQALDLVEAGAGRLGTSRGVALMEALRRPRTSPES